MDSFSQVDLGGPLVTEEDSVWWLIGDRSWAYGCVSGIPAAYGNVTFYLQWLYEQMQVLMTRLFKTGGHE